MHTLNRSVVENRLPTTLIRQSFPHVLCIGSFETDAGQKNFPVLAVFRLTSRFPAASALGLVYRCLT